MPRDYPDQGYFPGALVKLTIRFQEYDQKKFPPPPKTTTKNMKGTGGDRGTLHVTEDNSSGVKRFVLSSAFGQSNKSKTKGAAAKSSQADTMTYTIAGIIPKTADWGQNGIRTADTLSLTMKYLDAPFDPRVIRATAIEFYLGTFSEAQFGGGFKGQVTNTKVKSNHPLNVIPYDYVDGNGKQRTNLRFEGWVDEWVVDVANNAEPIIRLNCRDNTQLFIDQEAPANHHLDEKLPLDKAIASYLSYFIQFDGLEVEYRPYGDTPPVLNKVYSRLSIVPGSGTIPSKGGGANQKLSVWDHLTDIVRSLGHAIFLEGRTIVIQRARSLLSNASPPRPGDPFAGRAFGNTFAPYRRMIYGRNISDLRISRKYSRSLGTNIELRSYQTQGKGLIAARFPSTNERIQYGLPAVSQTEQKWTIFTVSGITDPKQMKITAQDIYESLNRNELGVEFKTNNYASFGGGAEDPDLLDSSPGDTIEILTNVDIDDQTNSYSFVDATMQSQELSVGLLKQLGFDPKLSAAYAEAFASANFQSVYRVRSVKTTWDADKGVDFAFQCVNYIEVVMDKANDAGSEPAKKGQFKKTKHPQKAQPGPPPTPNPTPAELDAAIKASVESE